MNDRLAALKLFARVAQTASFSRAGRELGLSQPSVSRLMAALERHVGNALLLRTTRAVTLTEAGADYLARIEPILAALDEADHAARGTGELRGVLRIGLPYSIAVREVIPRLPAFLQRHPKLRTELLMDDRRQDLLREGVDVAIRFGALPDSTATARLLGINQRLIVASPAYLKRAGKPKAPADLAAHTMIVGPAGSASSGWTFERHGKVTSVRADSRLIVNVNEGATVAALAGMGIISTGSWGVRAELGSGALVQLLPQWKMETTEVHAVFAAGRAAKVAARAFVDYLAGELDFPKSR